MVAFFTELDLSQGGRGTGFTDDEIDEQRQRRLEAWSAMVSFTTVYPADGDPFGVRSGLEREVERHENRFALMVMHNRILALERRK